MLILHMKEILPKTSPNSAEFLLFWYGWIQSPAASKRHDVRWRSFCWSIPLQIGNVWDSYIVWIISTPSSAYCIWNRHCRNHRRNCRSSFLLFACFATVEFNRLLCPNEKMYDDMVCADWFRYQLSMFEVCTLIGLSRLLDTHIACEIVVKKSRLVTGIMWQTISHAGL